MAARTIRPPAVSGLFYPASARSLQAHLAASFARAAPPSLSLDNRATHGYTEYQMEGECHG